jgi:hypothetical protein
VHNLHPQADAALLHELFAPYGKILSAQVETERGTGRGGGGLCTGRGRVQMAGFAQAEYAAQGDCNKQRIALFQFNTCVFLPSNQHLTGR